MAVLGLVLTMAADPCEREAAICVMDADPRVDVGTLAGLRLPIVIDVRSREEERHYLDALRAIPGVVVVDLVYAALDEPADREEER